MMRGLLLALGIVLVLPAQAPASSSEAGHRDFMRGIVVSCPGIGRIWGSEHMAEALREITELGANWISIHPYAGVRRDGTVRMRAAAETGYLERAGELVHRHGMRLFWKPHLAYWGSFEWRGAIDFGNDEAAWKRFFADYERFIVDQASFAEHAGAELFAVGVELEGTTRFEAEWRRIIANVREVFSGRLTYGANWDSLEAVPFWSELDLIGVHAYFPLSQSSDPSRDEILAGWEQPLRTLESLSKRHAKPVVFAEIGYNRSNAAARTPWTSPMTDDQGTRALRRRLMDVALERIEREPFIRGMFWWKWIPGDWRSDRDFSMRNPEARQALRESWALAESPAAEP